MHKPRHNPPHSSTPTQQPARYEGTYLSVPRITSSRQNVQPNKLNKSKKRKLCTSTAIPTNLTQKAPNCGLEACELTSPAKQHHLHSPDFFLPFFFSPLFPHPPKSYFKHKKKKKSKLASVRQIRRNATLRRKPQAFSGVGVGATNAGLACAAVAAVRYARCVCLPSCVCASSMRFLRCLDFVCLCCATPTA